MRRAAWRRRALLPLGFLVFVLALQWLAGIPHVSGDTQMLVTGAQATIDCLAAGEIARCETTAPPVYTTVGPFAIIQYLPAVTVLALGGTLTTALTTLWALSGLAFVGVLALGWLVADRTGHPAWAPGLAIVAVTGPLLFYGNSTFGEMLAAFLAMALVAAVALRRGWIAVAGTAWLAGITKESAFPFLLALSLIVLLGAPGRPRAFPRSQLAGLVLGIGLALATTGLFNLFRYGTLTNQLYLETPGLVQGLGSIPLERRPDFFAALFVSPNGGLLFFWPAAALLVAATAAVGLAPAFRRASLRQRWPALALIGSFAAMLAGFASFTYPFGWHAWGPRYTVALVPAFALAAVVVHGEELARYARPLVVPIRELVLTGAALVLFALPHIGALVLPSAFAKLFLPNERCGSIETLRGEHYLDCLHALAWERRPMLLDGIDALPGGQPGSSWVIGALTVAVFGLLAVMRARLSEPSECRESTV